MSIAPQKKDLNPSTSNSPGNANSGGERWYKKPGAIVGLVIFAAAFITGLALLILWGFGVIWTGIDTSTPEAVGPQGPPPVPSATPPGPSANPGPKPGPSPNPGPKPGPSPSPGPKPGPSPSPGPKPGPSPSPAPSANPGPKPGPSPIIPEQYEEPLNCVINSANENCYDAPSDVSSFTYDQAVNGGPVKEGGTSETDSTSNLVAGYGVNNNFELIFSPLILLTGDTTDKQGTFETAASSTWDTRYMFRVTEGTGFYVKLNHKHLEVDGAYTGTLPPTQFLGFNMGGGTVGAYYQTQVPVYNGILNLTVEIYPTTDVDSTGTTLTPENQVTSRDVVLDVDEGKLTKTYEFSPFSSDYMQYYLVVYEVGSSKEIVFANQYPLYMTLNDNNRPYATVNINNLTCGWDGSLNFAVGTVTPNLYFYITDGFSDLANLPTDTNGAISSDSNCITYPYEIKVTNAAYTTVTSVSNSTKTVTPELNCVLESGVGPCYNPASSWTEPGVPSTVEEDGNNVYVYDEVRLLQNNDATVASSLTLTDGEQTYLAIGATGQGYMTTDVQGTGVILQNTSNSALNVSMYLEINPCGGEQPACDSCYSAPAAGCLPADDEGDPPNINWGASSTKLYYLVAFTTNGIYANQFPLFFKNAENNSDDVGAQAYVSVSNLVLTPTSIPAPTSVPTASPTPGDQLYFFISDSMLDLSTAYIQNTSGGPWTIDPGNAYVFAPNEVHIWNLKYSIMQ